MGVPSSAVRSALAQVGLPGREKERFGSYSLGMKQRLAIAATLLRVPAAADPGRAHQRPGPGRDTGHPGDDPRLGDSGVTVLLSSHILAEVQQVCHSVTIIGQGRVLASGTVDDLVGEGSVGACSVTLADPAAATTTLRRSGFTVRPDGERLVVERPAGPAGATGQAAASLGEDVARALAAQGLFPRELRAVHPDLESVFLRLTQDTSLHTAPPAGSTTTTGNAS